MLAHTNTPYKVPINIYTSIYYIFLYMVAINIYTCIYIYKDVLSISIYGGHPQAWKNGFGCPRDWRLSA